MSMGRRRKAKRPIKLVRTDETNNVNSSALSTDVAGRKSSSSENKENLVDDKSMVDDDNNVNNANNSQSVGNSDSKQNETNANMIETVKLSNVLGKQTSNGASQPDEPTPKKQQPSKRANNLLQSEFIFQSPTKRTTTVGSPFRRKMTPTYHTYRTRKAAAAKQTSIKLAVALSKLKAFNLYKIQRGKKIIDYITNRDSNESDSKSSASEPASPMAVTMTSPADAAVDRHYSFTKIRHIPLADACKQSQEAAFPSNQSISTILSSISDKSTLANDKKSSPHPIKIKDVVVEPTNLTTIPTSGGKQSSTSNAEPSDQHSKISAEKQSKGALRKYMYTKIKDIPVETSKPEAKARMVTSLSTSQTTVNKIPPLESGHQKKVTKHESTTRAYAYKIKDYISTTQPSPPPSTTASSSINSEPVVPAAAAAAATTNTIISQTQFEHRSQHLKLNQIIAGVTNTSDTVNKRSFKIKDHFEVPSTVATQPPPPSTTSMSNISLNLNMNNNTAGQYQPMLLIEKPFDLKNYNSKQIVQ